MPRADAVIIPTDDVAELVMADITSTKTFNVEIIGVPQLDSYKVCLKYKAQVELLTPPLGKCSNLGCAMMQWYDWGPNQLSGKLMVIWTDREMGTYTQSLFMYGRTVSSIAGIDEDDDDHLQWERHHPLLFSIILQQISFVELFIGLSHII